MLSTGLEPMTLALSEPRATNCARRANSPEMELIVSWVAPDVRLEPTSSRLRGWRSPDWVNRAFAYLISKSFHHYILSTVSMVKSPSGALILLCLVKKKKLGTKRWKSSTDTLMLLELRGTGIGSFVPRVVTAIPSWKRFSRSRTSDPLLSRRRTPAVPISVRIYKVV